MTNPTLPRIFRGEMQRHFSGISLKRAFSLEKIKYHNLSSFCQISSLFSQFGGNIQCRKASIYNFYYSSEKKYPVNFLLQQQQLSTLSSTPYDTFTHSCSNHNSGVPTTSTMKAAVLHSHGSKFNIEYRPIPEPGKDQVLVKIICSGVCHTDVHAADGDWPIKSKIPLICGHEGAGYVIKVGESVDPNHVKIGDRVGIPWLHSACGECEFCLSGRETLCQKILNTGYSVDGCFSEYTLAPADYVCKIPEKLSLEQAAPILCAGVTTYKGLKVSQCHPGEYIGIIGAGGGLGHVAIQYAKAMGLRVLAIDIGEEKLKFCSELGADMVLDGSDPALKKRVMKATGGGCHGLMILATNTSIFNKAVGLIRSDGHIVLIGLPKGKFDLPIFEVVARGISVHGSIVGTRLDMKEALDFAAHGDIKCIIHKDKIENINHIFDELRQGQINGRTVIMMDEDPQN